MLHIKRHINNIIIAKYNKLENAQRVYTALTNPLKNSYIWKRLLITCKCEDCHIP